MKNISTSEAWVLVVKLTMKTLIICDALQFCPIFVGCVNVIDVIDGWNVLNG